MTFTPPSQTAHNVRVRKIQRTQFVAPASRRLSRGHLARASYSGKPAKCFSKSLFLKILPVSPIASRFCEYKGHSSPRKSFINKILRVFDSKIILSSAQGSCVLPVREQSYRPHLATEPADRLFIISVPLRKKRTPWHSTIKSTNCGKRS